MVAILQTTFSNVYSWMKSSNFGKSAVKDTLAFKKEGNISHTTAIASTWQPIPEPINGVTEVCFYGFNWQYPNIGSANGSAPNRRRAIIWTNAYPIHWPIYVALGGDEFTPEIYPYLKLCGILTALWPVLRRSISTPLLHMSEDILLYMANCCCANFIWFFILLMLDLDIIVKTKTMILYNYDGHCIFHPPREARWCINI